MKEFYRKGAAVLAALWMVVSLAACGVTESTQGQITPEDCQTAVEEAAEQARKEGFSAGYARGLAEGQASSAPTEEEVEPSTGQEGFVSISEAIPDAILEIRYYSTYNFVGDRITGYEAPVALLTEEAAAALREVSDELVQKGYRLKIYDAYRPQQAVNHFKAWAEDLEDQRMKSCFYPEVEKTELFARGYISGKSGHSRGSTVDLTLFDMERGKEVDMGGTFDFFGPASHADYSGELTEVQKANRALLRDTMLAHGFRGISTEWWHFTLKNEPYPDTYFDFPVAELP